MTGKMTETILTVFWALGVLSSGRLHSTLNTADSGGNDSPRLIPKDDLLPSDGLTGARRDKPACCRGCKSATGKEVANPSWPRSSLAGVIARWRLKRRPEAPVGGAIELRKARRSGC